MNYQLIAEIVGAAVVVAVICVAVYYAEKYDVLSNSVIETVISLIENYLGKILTTPQLQQFYVLLLDAINAVVVATTPGESEADIEAAIATLINQGIVDLGWPPLDPTLLAEIISFVMVLVNAIGSARFVSLGKNFSIA